MDKSYILRQRNTDIKQAIDRINNHLDRELFVSDMLKEEQKYLGILAQHRQEEARLEKAMIKQRDIYVKRSSDLKGTFAAKNRNLKGLYMRLRRKYEFEAKMNNTAVRSIDAWEIPVDHAPPIATLPKAAPEFNPDEQSVMRHLRQSVRHYRFRAHWSTRSAQTHLEKLNKIECEQAKVSAKLTNSKTKVLANIDSVIKNIYEIRDRLVNNPPNHIWEETFNAYAYMVKDHFKAIQAKEIAVENKLRGTLLIGNPVVSCQTVPVRSTMRRMDGEDINDIGSLFTASTAKRNTLLQSIPSIPTGARHSYSGTNPLLRMSKSMTSLDGNLQRAWMAAEKEMQDCCEPEAYSAQLRKSITEDLALMPEYYDYPVEYADDNDSSSVYDEREGRNAVSPLTPDTPIDVRPVRNYKRPPKVGSQQSLASVIIRSSR